MSLQLLTILSPTTPCIPTLLLTALSRDRSRNDRSPFTGRFPFLASPLRCRLANASGRIEFIIVLFMDWSFASSCSPPRLSTSQLLSATDRPVLLSDWDFHPIVGAHFQAHIFNRFAVKYNGRLANFCYGFAPLGSLFRNRLSLGSSPTPCFGLL